MSKHIKKLKMEMRIHFRDGKTDIIPQKYWDDYEITDYMLVIKKNGVMVGFYKLDIIDCMVVARK